VCKVTCYPSLCQQNVCLQRSHRWSSNNLKLHSLKALSRNARVAGLPEELGLGVSMMQLIANRFHPRIHLPIGIPVMIRHAQSLLERKVAPIYPALIGAAGAHFFTGAAPFTTRFCLHIPLCAPAARCVSFNGWIRQIRKNDGKA